MIGIIVAAILWGTTGTAATLLPAQVSPLTTGAATMTVGGLLLTATAPRRTLAVLRDRHGAWRWLIPGALSVAIYPLAFYSSMSLAGVAIGNVVSLGTAPVFATLLERLLDPPDQHTVRQPRSIVAAGAAVAGVAMLAAFGHHSSFAVDARAGTTLPGVALGAIAGFSYATYTYTASRMITHRHSSRGAMAAQFGLGAILLLPVLLLTGGSLLHNPTTAPGHTPIAGLLGTPPPMAVVLYLAVGPMFVAYLMFGRGLRTVPSSRATTVTLLEPFVATLLAVVAVGERLPPLGWVGLALVLTGVVVVATDQTNKPAQETYAAPLDQTDAARSHASTPSR